MGYKFDGNLYFYVHDGWVMNNSETTNSSMKFSDEGSLYSDPLAVWGGSS